MHRSPRHDTSLPPGSGWHLEVAGQRCERSIDVVAGIDLPSLHEPPNAAEDVGGAWAAVSPSEGSHGACHESLVFRNRPLRRATGPAA
jgi:hypothetical protein